MMFILPQALCSHYRVCYMVSLASQSLLSFITSSVNTAQPTAPAFTPAVHSYQAAGSGMFHIPPSLHIIVDETYASSTRDDGPTLIPPTLIDFAHTFASDFQELFPRSSVAVALGSESYLNRLTDYVYLTFLRNPNNTLADGSSTSEGYNMEVTPKGVKISASGAKGAFWATRTLLQGLVLSDGRFPASVINDQPDWRTRGIMLG